ncbi:hypothetical protein ACHAPT_001317 [Fusarium lateritium]
MAMPLRIGISLVLAFQLWLSPAESESIIGYYVGSSKIETVTCPNWGSFNWASENPLANCDVLGTATNDGYIGKSCDGESVVYAEYTSGAPQDGHWFDVFPDEYTLECDSGFPCITVTLYESYNGGEGKSSHCIISCQNSIGVPDGVDKLFFERPTIDGTTIATETDDTTSNPTNNSRTSTAPTSTAVETEGNDNKLGAGVIAGIVVGSVAGVVLIACALVMAFRMGRKKGLRDDPENSRKSLVDRLRAFPRPALVWRHPDSTAGGGMVETKAELPASSEVPRPAGTVNEEAGTQDSGVEPPAGLVRNPVVYELDSTDRRRDSTHGALP